MDRQLSDEQWAPIDGEVSAGRMIQAIKIYREVTGADLAAAKAAVEARAGELRQRDPQKYALARKKGCAGVILLSLAILLPLLYLAA